MNRIHQIIHRTLATMLLSTAASPVFAQFDLQLTISNPSAFSAEALTRLEEAIPLAEQLWEREILGYQSGITQTVLPISIQGSTATGLADASGFGRTTVGDDQFVIFTSGRIRINPNQVVPFSRFPSPNADPPTPMVNVLDELIAHEIAHVLGIGPLWIANGVYEFGSGEYTGEFGLAAYREEFDRDAEYIPVELDGANGSANVHWDQFFRSAEGPPGVDPFDLSPETGITDAMGRDLGLELLTAAIDPDFGEPFLARFTVESLRDLGFRVRAVPEPSGAGLVLACLLAAGTRRRERAPKNGVV